MENAAETTDDNKSQRASKSAKNKEVTLTPTDGSTTSKKPAQVPTDDSTNTIKVTSSDKLNYKLDSDLAEIAQAWPRLSPAIRSAIVAIVRTSKDQ